MNGYRDFMSGYGLAVGEMGLTGLILGVIFAFVPGERFCLPFMYWAVFLGVQLLADFLLLRWELSLNVYLIFNLAAIIFEAYFMAVHTSFTALGNFVPGFAALCASVAGVHMACCAYKIPGIRWNLRYVDFLVITAAACLLLSHFTNQKTAYDILLMAAIAVLVNLAIISRVRLREDDVPVIQGTGAGGRLALVAVIFAIGMVTAAAAAISTGEIQSAVDLILMLLQIIWKAAEALITIFTVAVGYIMLFFMWIFPGGNGIVEDRVQGETQEIIGQVKTSAAVLPGWFWQAAGVLIFFIIATWCLWKFRGVKLKQHKRTVSIRKKIVKKSRFGEAAAGLLRKLFSMLQFEWQYRCNRNTAAGLLIYAQRRGRTRKVGRREGESAGAFLRRLCREGKEPELAELAEKLEKIFYGKGFEQPDAKECRRFRRMLDRAVAAYDVQKNSTKKQN